MARSFGQLSDALRNVNCSEDVEKKKVCVGIKNAAGDIVTVVLVLWDETRQLFVSLITAIGDGKHAAVQIPK